MTKFKVIGEPILANISNRHIHLSQQDLIVLFGENHKLKNILDLVQVGQFACKEKVTIAGPKGVLNKVRVIGPTRNITQVEISRTDGFVLGINPPLTDSGHLEEAAPIKVIGPEGEINFKQNCIVVRGHIHMSPKDAKMYKVKDNDKVCIRVEGKRGLIFENIQIRVKEDFALECQLDTDEANACCLKNGDKVKMISFE